mmetsp:Transcript_56328/g.138247  ORF Transcript_56328/g.138247 Transcript_56328/m.138247 type:complete len:251 (-) Transcript_56328:10-762(-)
MVKGIHLPLQNVPPIRTLVHEVQLGEHADGALPLRVHFTRDLEPVGVGEVLVGGGDGQDDAVGARDDVEDHAADHFGDVVRLIPHRHLGEAWEVDQGEVDDILAVYTQDDGLGRHVLAAARDPVRLGLDGLLDVVKRVDAAREVRELRVVLIHVLVHQLEDEWAAGADAGAAGEEVVAYEVLEDRRLARALAPHHRDLGEVDGGDAEGGEGLLQLVHHRDQLVERHGAGGSAFRGEAYGNTSARTEGIFG